MKYLPLFIIAAFAHNSFATLSAAKLEFKINGERMSRSRYQNDEVKNTFDTIFYMSMFARHALPDRPKMFLGKVLTPMTMFLMRERLFEAACVEHYEDVLLKTKNNKGLPEQFEQRALSLNKLISEHIKESDSRFVPLNGEKKESVERNLQAICAVFDCTYFQTREEVIASVLPHFVSELSELSASGIDIRVNMAQGERPIISAQLMQFLESLGR